VYRAAATRWPTLALVAALAFGGAFFAARALNGDGGSSNSKKVELLSAPAVSIDNLERVPTMKPLRSAPGSPPQPVPQAQGPIQQPATGSGATP
jgi:hypothetical protein